jgi:hypothetical protein
MEAPFGVGQGLEGTVVPNVDRWMNGWIKQGYNPNFKLMLNNHAVKSNKCNAARKLRVSETNIQKWRQHKEKVINMNDTGKCFNRSQYIVSMNQSMTSLSLCV